jgi:hypothetical protein
LFDRLFFIIYSFLLIFIIFILFVCLIDYFYYFYIVCCLIDYFSFIYSFLLIFISAGARRNAASIGNLRVVIYHRACSDRCRQGPRGQAGVPGACGCGSGGGGVRPNSAAPWVL